MDKKIETDSEPVKLQHSLPEDVSIKSKGECNPPTTEETRSDHQTHCTTGSDLLYYKMNGCKKAIIINMHNFKTFKERIGSEKDVKSLERTFKYLNFEIVKLENCNRQKLMEELDKHAVADYKKYDCLAVIIMTHGNENDTLYCSDEQSFTLREIEEKFLPENCPELAGKPKLFFLQACRGHRIIDSYKVYDARKEENVEIQHRIPKTCDVLEFFSTEQGNVSARKEGTWFIQTLAKNLNEYGYRKSLLHILTYVIHDVAISMEEEDSEGRIFKQQPVLVSRLCKIVKF